MVPNSNIKMVNNCLSLNNLNDDCLIYIFGLINGSDRIDLELVCRRWKELSRGNRRSWKSYQTLDITDEHLGYQIELTDTENAFTITLCKRIISSCFSYLTKINLSGVEPFQDSHDVLNLEHKCSGTEKFSDSEDEFSGKRLETFNDIKMSLSECHNIEELYLCPCVISVNDEFLKYLFKSNKKLRIVVLSDFCLTGECFPYLSTESLESFVLNWCYCPNTDCRDTFVSSAPKLHTLVVDNGYFDFASMLINSTSNLIRFSVMSHSDFSQLYFPGICNSKDLTYLVLRDINLDDEELTLIIESCKKVAFLDITCNEFLTDISLENTGSLPHLKGLGIAFNDNFTDAGLLSLSQNLRSLDLKGTTFSSDAILAILRKMTYLKDLELDLLDQLDEKFVESAIDIVEHRQNKTPLKMSTWQTSIVISKIKSEYPLVTWDETTMTIMPQMCREN